MLISILKMSKMINNVLFSKVSGCQWVIFLSFCAREESCGYQFWKYILALDNWKKSLLYTCLSVVCYLHPKEFWQALICGVLLDLTGLLYLIRTFRTRNASEPYKYKQLEVR